MVVGESFRVSRRFVYPVSARLSSGPPGGRPHTRLKAGTPREAPTPAPTTKTPSPQQRIGAVRGPNQRGERHPVSSHTNDLNIGTPVATLPGAWRYRVSTGTGWLSVSILWLGEVEGLICTSISVWQHVNS